MKRFSKSLISLILILFVALSVNSCAKAQEFAYATDLTDGIQVQESQYSFHLTVLYGDSKIEPEVNCNGIFIEGIEDTYTVFLQKGKNVIEITAEHENEKSVRNYTVIYNVSDNISDEKPDEPSSDTPDFKIETSLTDAAIVTDKSFCFTVSALYGDDVCAIDVSCNGILLSSNDENYTASLHDGNNKIEISAYFENNRFAKTYTVVYRAEFAIGTTIDTAVINNDSIVFSVSATFNDDPCAFAVMHNGKEIKADNDLYHAELITGNNTFTVIARSGDHIKTQEWNIVYDSFELITDLESKDTGYNKISFRATARYGNRSCDFAVSANGKTVKPNGAKYELTLENGENRIVFTLKTDNAVKEYVYIVRYIDAPPTLTANIVDFKNYKGSVYSFDVIAKDGLGAKLSASQISFLIDWNASDSADDFVVAKGISLVWDDSTMTSFRIDFKSADFTSHANTPFILKVTATDGFGRSTACAYTMTYTPVSANEPIGETIFSLEGFSIGCGYFIEPMSVSIYEGVPFAKTLTEILTEHGYKYTNTGSVGKGFYLASIIGLDLTGNRIADGIWDFVKDRGYVRSIAAGGPLGEFDYGSGSGWMYSVNGVYKNYGFSDYYPQDGDVVRVQFTVILGEDLGGGGALGGDNLNSLLGDNPDYAPIMKLLADIAADKSADKTVYNEVINAICKWNISQKEMDKQFNKLKATYRKQ